MRFVPVETLEEALKIALPPPIGTYRRDCNDGGKRPEIYSWKFTIVNVAL
jgi:hypothetical protein